MEPVVNAADPVGEETVARARRWIGTPYEHQASCRGAGTDCLGLVRGLWREMLGSEPEAAPAYTPDWSEPGRTEDLMAAADRNLVAVSRKEPSSGDVALFRMADGAVAKHMGIIAKSPQGYATLIHAYSGHGVVESPLTPAWQKRLARLYRFPDRRP